MSLTSGPMSMMRMRSPGMSVEGELERIPSIHWTTLFVACSTCRRARGSAAVSRRRERCRRYAYSDVNVSMRIMTVMTAHQVILPGGFHAFNLDSMDLGSHSHECFMRINTIRKGRTTMVGGDRHRNIGERVRTEECWILCG